MSTEGKTAKLTYHFDYREISYIMRYLLQYPSEAQVRDYIIPKVSGLKCS